MRWLTLPGAGCGKVGSCVGICRTAATISGISFLVSESVPLHCLAAGVDVDSPDAENEVLLLLPLGPEVETAVERVETEPVEQVEVELVEWVEVTPRRDVLRVVCLGDGSLCFFLLENKLSHAQPAVICAHALFPIVRPPSRMLTVPKL